MKKRILSLLLAFVLVFSFSMAVNAKTSYGVKDSYTVKKGRSITVTMKNIQNITSTHGTKYFKVKKKSAKKFTITGLEKTNGKKGSVGFSLGSSSNKISKSGSGGVKSFTVKVK